jgi:hypothetical protein
VLLTEMTCAPSILAAQTAPVLPSPLPSACQRSLLDLNDSDVAVLLTVIRNVGLEELVDSLKD